MKRAPDSRSFLPVKAALIVITVTAVTGGFALGYFVGKGVSSPTVIPILKQPVNDTASVTPVPNPNSDTRNESPSSAGTVRQIPSTDNKQTAAAMPISHETPPLKAEEKAEIKEEKKKDLYTVQIGAFKHQKDANTLKRNLEAKGFTAYINKESNSKGVTIFKVRTGEFEDKKEAAAFALKLKKEFRLNSFAMIKR